jgi:hypothetical protein
MKEIEKKFLSDAKEVVLWHINDKYPKRNAEFEEVLNNIDNQSYQIFRSFESKDDYILFPLDIEWPFHKSPTIMTGLKASYKIAKKIEKVFSNQFTFSISGRGMHAITKFMKTEHEFPYIYMLNMSRAIDYMIGQYGFFCEENYKKNAIIRAYGSFNPKAELWDVPIDISWPFDKALYNAKHRILYDYGEIKELDVSISIHKTIKTKSSSSKLEPFDYVSVSSEIDLRYIPPCVRLLFDHNIYKSHFLRLLIITYLNNAVIRFRNGLWRKLGVDEIYSLLKDNMPEGDYNEAGTFKHSLKENTVRWCRDREYAVPSCEVVRQWGYCVSGCNRSDPMELV